MIHQYSILILQFILRVYILPVISYNLTITRLINYNIKAKYFLNMKTDKC